jgi:glycosyltransferase involved in cell wall biosynthesis
MKPLASVVITTLNRLDETIRAVESVIAQDYGNIEILVFDDASKNGIGAAIARRFPEVRCFVNEQRRGYIENRNRGFVEASGTYVFSLDDDAYYASCDLVGKTVAMFEADESITAIAMPYIEPSASRSGSTIRTPCRSQPGDELRSFVGCAHAVRRDAVLGRGGYRAALYYLREEQDLATRIWKSGGRIVYGDGCHTVHMVGRNRDPRMSLHYGARNQMLLAVLNFPLPFMAWRVVYDATMLLSYKFTIATLKAKVSGVLAGIKASWIHRSHRDPMTIGQYRQWRRLPTHGPEDWVGELPSPCVARGGQDRHAREPGGNRT